MLSTKEEKQMKNLREVNTQLQVKLHHYLTVIDKLKLIEDIPELKETIDKLLEEAEIAIKADIG